MYCSLDRIDIVTKAEAHAYCLIQIDHRTPQEIATAPDLSVLLALIRAVAPLAYQPDPDRSLLPASASEGDPAPSLWLRLTNVFRPKSPPPAAAAEPTQPLDIRVVALFSHPPPGFLREAIETAGGFVTLDADAVPPPPPAIDFKRVALLFGAAAGRLAETTARDESVQVSLEGLEQIEQRFIERLPPSDDRPEIGYWEPVIRLGSFTSEVILRSRGGRWLCDPHTRSATLPFVLETPLKEFPDAFSTSNVLGKARKHIDGEGSTGDAPSALVRSVLSM